MTHHAPVGNSRRLFDQLKYFEGVCYVRLWYCGLNGSLWFHPSVFINIPPGSGNINTTIKNPDGEVVPAIVSRSGHLLELDDGWLTSGVHPIFCVILDTFTKWSGHSY